MTIIDDFDDGYDEAKKVNAVTAYSIDSSVIVYRKYANRCS